MQALLLLVSATAFQGALEFCRELGLEHGKLFVLAHRTPRDLAPATETEYALYRRVKSMTQAEQRKLLTDLGERRRRP